MITFDNIIDNAKLMGIAIFSTLGIDVHEIIETLQSADNRVFMSDTVLRPLIAFMFVKLLDYTIGDKITLLFDKIKSIFK